MSARQWDEITYSQVPSVAFNNYKKAFERHSEERFNAFVTALKEGKAKVNAATLFPHDIGKQIKPYYYTPANIKKMDIDLLQAQWDALPQYEGVGSILPVVDVSGSMSTTLGWESTTTALHTSVSLGVYLAEKIQWPFKDHIISFSGKPSLHHLTGNIVQKYLQANDSWEDMSTNLVGVFEALLHAAEKNNISKEDMPKTLIILSDMEFNQCGNNSETNFRYIKQLYRELNYEMPKLVFWNLLGRLNNYPVQADTPNTILLSGYSPSLLKTVLKGSLNPVDAMMDTINVDRYKFIEVPSTIS